MHEERLGLPSLRVFCHRESPYSRVFDSFPDPAIASGGYETGAKPEAIDLVR